MNIQSVGSPKQGKNVHTDVIKIHSLPHHIVIIITLFPHYYIFLRDN